MAKHFLGALHSIRGGLLHRSFEVKRRMGRRKKAEKFSARALTFLGRHLHVLKTNKFLAQLLLQASDIYVNYSWETFFGMGNEGEASRKTKFTDKQLHKYIRNRSGGVDERQVICPSADMSTKCELWSAVRQQIKLIYQMLQAGGILTRSYAFCVQIRGVVEHSAYDLLVTMAISSTTLGKLRPVRLLLAIRCLRDQFRVLSLHFVIWPETRSDITRSVSFFSLRSNLPWGKRNFLS